MIHFHTIFIGVNYKTPDETKRWVESIRKTNKDVLVVVVDNSKEFNKALEKEIHDEYDELVVYLNSGSNLGYFNGAAFGFDYIKKRYTFDWIAVSNVDLLVESEGIDAVLDKYNNAGIVAPAIISSDSGFDKNPYRMFRSSKRDMMIKKMAFSNALFSIVFGFVSGLRNEAIKKKHISEKRCNEGESVYLPYGACLFFSKLYFERGCVIKYPLFIFGEELFVAEQCRKNNLDVVYVPSIRITNFEHASTSKLVNDFVRKSNYKAISYIIKKYY